MWAVGATDSSSSYIFSTNLFSNLLCSLVTLAITCFTEICFFPDLVVARLSSACCSWRCRFPSSPVSLRLIQLSQYLGRSMVSLFPHSSKFPLFYVSLHPMGQFFASFSSPFFARSGNNGSRLPYLRRHDDLFVLCCRVNDPGWGGLHFQLVAGFGICQFLSFYRVI